MASVDGRLHVCAIEVNGQIERNIFDPIATNSFEGWTDVEMNIGSETGRFVDVGCAGGGWLMGVTNSGHQFR